MLWGANFDLLNNYFWTLNDYFFLLFISWLLFTWIIKQDVKQIISLASLKFLQLHCTVSNRLSSFIIKILSVLLSMKQITSVVFLFFLSPLNRACKWFLLLAGNIRMLINRNHYNSMIYLIRDKKHFFIVKVIKNDKFLGCWEQQQQLYTKN